MIALADGNEELAKYCMKFAKHMIEIAPQFEHDMAAFNHMLRCDMCFTFSLKSGTLMSLKKVWAASEEHGAADHPWAENWSLLKN
jgi:hypothetical protein